MITFAPDLKNIKSGYVHEKINFTITYVRAYVIMQ